MTTFLLSAAHNPILNKSTICTSLSSSIAFERKKKKKHWAERAHERAFAPLCPLLWEWKASLHIKTSNSSFVTRRGRSGRVHLHFTLSLLFSPSLWSLYSFLYATSEKKREIIRMEWRKKKEAECVAHKLCERLKAVRHFNWIKGED